MIQKIKEIYLQFTAKTAEEMAKKLEYTINTPVVIYTDTPTFIDGGIGIIIERDPFTLSYGVVLLEDYYVCNGDIMVLLKRHLKWIDPENLEPISLDKKISIIQRIKDGFAKLVTHIKNW